MNVQGLIADAIYNSVQDQEHQPIINPIFENYGLQQLNFILDEWRDKIPFGQEFTFNSFAQLTGTNFISVQNVTFVLNQVSTPLFRRTLTEFKYQKTILNLVGVPLIYYFDELAQNIDVYPPPSMPVFQFIVWGRVNNVPLTLFEVLPSTITPFMTNALSYELAYRICIRFGVPWSEDKEKNRLYLIDLLNSKLSIDLKPPQIAVFGKPKSSTTAPFPFFYALSGGSF